MIHPISFVPDLHISLISFQISSSPNDVASGDFSSHPRFTSMDADEKRKASDKISKNREYAERRGKKKAKTSKVGSETKKFEWFFQNLIQIYFSFLP